MPVYMIKESDIVAEFTYRLSDDLHTETRRMIFSV